MARIIKERKAAPDNRVAFRLNNKPQPKPQDPDRFLLIDTVEGDQVYAKSEGGALKLCVPNSDGILLVSDSILSDSQVKGSEDLNGVLSMEAKLRRFETRPEFEIDSGKLLTVRDETTKAISDYQNISTEGLASTFANVTPSDRDGDAIAKNAFDRTIAQFKTNPVMLIDHNNSVHSIAGSFSHISKTENGLAVRGEVSNSPDLRKVRFLIAEGHLKAFSIGGMFRFDNDQKNLIAEIELFEISLVAVPANPDALFQARSIGITEAKRAFKSPTTLSFK